jgi:phage shock protein A
MGIFSRMGDIVAANINDLLDKADDPAKMIRLVILEMEETLVEVRASAARTIADQKETRRALARAEQAQADWVEKAELALSKDREDLAKAAILEKQKLGTACEQMHRDMVALDEVLAKQEEDIVKLQAKLSEARARQKTIVSRLESVENRVRMRKQLYGGRVDDAFARFDMLERRVDMAEGRVEAFDIGRGKSLSEEIADLKAADAADAELAALKAKLAKKD